MVDDFWGPEQWEIFRQTMDRVFPGQPITDIAETDPVMHVLYDIQEKDRTFIPGSRLLRRGPGGTVQVVQPEGTTPAWRAMYDDKNRMVVAINFNTDVGDAWEFADVPYYPEAMTTLAYRYGINYILYSMSTSCADRGRSSPSAAGRPSFPEWSGRCPAMTRRYAADAVPRRPR